MGEMRCHLGLAKKTARVILLLIFFGSHTLFAQPLSLKQFLKSSTEDVFYKSFNHQTSYLDNGSNYSLPWVNQIQFRFQDTELNDYQYRSGLRVDIANPWQIIRNKKYFQGYQTLKKIEQKMVLKEILHDRYEKVVEYWIAHSLADLTEKQKKIREQIGYAIGQKAGSSNFDADQYLNAQLDIITKETDLQEANFDRDVALTKIMETANASGFDLSMEDMIDVDQLLQSETSVGTTTEFEFRKQRVTMAENKMKLENANIDIGYLQHIYSYTYQDPLLNKPYKNPFGLAFGITLPIVKLNKDKIAEEKLTMMERQGELDKFQSEEKSERINALAYLKLHLRHYQKMDSLTTAVKSKGMNKLSGVANNYDPVVELKYQEKLLQFDLLKIRIKRQILLQYISFLDNSDKLHERPLINYLSKNLEQLED
jgi:hypothetical protein